jgi:predicted NAD/FAD-dependent oxidoreductase
MLVHSTNAWADAHIDGDIDAILAHMLAEASAIGGVDLRVADYCGVHRWRLANMDKRGGPEFFIDDGANLAACGDWFLRGRVEAAFMSANALASKLRNRL